MQTPWLTRFFGNYSEASGQQVQSLRQNFNFTLSYHSKSDFQIQEYSLENLKVDYEKKYNRSWTDPDIAGIFKRKKETLLAFLSNCHREYSSNQRQYQLKQLKKTLGPKHMRFLGRCGSDSKISDDTTWKHQGENLKRRYKFFAAFENGQCDEYISEKLWENALMHDSIPLVSGPKRECYEKVLPKNSFIHVDDYTTIGELSEALKNIAGNYEEYQKFFQWRMDYSLRRLKNNFYGNHFFVFLRLLIVHRKNQICL